MNSEEAGETVNPEGPAELVTRKGDHSNEVMKDLKEVGFGAMCRLKQRGEKLERTFAHMYETGGMRRTHISGHKVASSSPNTLIAVRRRDKREPLRPVVVWVAV